MQVPEYKTLFIGPSGIGKTSFLTKLFHRRNDVNVLNIPTTLGVDVTPIALHQDYRKIRLNVWDCAGNKKYKGTEAFNFKNFQFRYLDVESEATTSIFGDYVSIHLIKGKPLIILIKNKYIAKSFKNHFEYLWEKAK